MGTNWRMPTGLHTSAPSSSSQHGPVTDRTFEIAFLDPGAQAFAFTFG